MGHTSLLIRTRVRAAKNRFAALGPSSWRLLLGLAAWVCGLTVLGHVSAPDLLSPPQDLVAVIAANPEAGFPAGAAALEACFWLTATASSITGFRVMELLFRRDDIRAVEFYPFSLRSLYVDRLLAASVEAVAAALLVIPFFLPLVWHGGAIPAVVCASLLVLGLLSSNVVGLSVQLWAGSTLVDEPEEKEERSSKSIYGGPGQVFMYSPGLSLAISVVLILLAKLALGEVLDDGLQSRALWLGIGILGAATALAALAGWRYFTRGFHRMAARFREADFVGYEVSADYQRSAFEVPRFGEKLLNEAARPVFRATALQYKRRYMLTRYAYGIFWLVGGIAVFQASEAAFPLWIQRLAAVVAVGIFFNPWVRVLSTRIRPEFDDYLPITNFQRRSADTMISLIEALLVAGPYAILLAFATALHGEEWGFVAMHGASALAAVLALSGVISITSIFEGNRGSALGRIAICAAALVGLAIASNAGALWLLVVSGVLALGNITLLAPLGEGSSPEAKPSL
ncbi:MAG: hypothetical protein ACQEVA_06770 [Myxococcota bacterium]